MLTVAEKTCSKCGFIGDEALFVKNRNQCKKCKNEYQKKYQKENPEKGKIRSKRYREKHPEKIKEYSEKYRKEHSEEVKVYNIKWRKEHPEKVKEYSKNWREQNPEKIKERDKKYYKENSKKVKESVKKYRQENPKKTNERSRKWASKNSDKVQLKNRKYNQTLKGKITAHRHKAKRRNLGHKPINMWFKGSEAHHLRYSRNIKEQDNDITLYVPRKLHKSIYHNGHTGQGMKEINIACLKWYFKNTPKEEQNPKATKLYNNYLTLPEPQWR